MARILQQARRSPLFSPSRLQTLIRPLSPTPPPPLPSLSPSSPAAAAARSYIAAMRRSAFQENLLRILRTEIDYEVDVRPPQEPVPKFKSFVVEDRPGERWITLRGKHGGKEIKVDASMFDYAFPVPNGDKTEESRGENMKLHISLVVDVGCGGGGGDPVLQFICSAWPDELEIEHLRVVQNGRPLLCPFMGPRFKDVDEKTQDALLEYLEERGVDDELAAFLHQYMMNKDRREFVRWMESVKSYLEKMSGNDLSFNPDGFAVNPGAFQQHIRRDSQMMAQLLQKYWVDEKTGCNCFMLYARDLTIVWGEDARYWRWNELQETSNLSIEVAELANVCWLEINGKFEMSYLTPGAAYEVAFVVMISHSSYGWNAPVNLRLTDPQGNVQKRQESLVDKPKGKWIELVVGQLETRAASAGEVEVSLFEYEDGAWKSGLVVKGIRIRPS